MQVHIFRATGRVFGFTQNNSGANLPQQYGPWNAFKKMEMIRGETMPGMNIDEYLDDITIYGYHLTDAHVRITENQHHL
ncbi:hypothetical protein LJR231_003176 [Phyllobacterium sp. LjRoot231]|uniref:hypothetical protein n=1 Tax=Phyllobacterium sp. LjRoot231 TaxID=3342289 RepID=UPI003ECD0BBB